MPSLCRRVELNVVLLTTCALNSEIIFLKTSCNFWKLLSVFHFCSCLSRRFCDSFIAAAAGKGDWSQVLLNDTRNTAAADVANQYFIASHFVVPQSVEIVWLLGLIWGNNLASSDPIRLVSPRLPPHTLWQEWWELKFDCAAEHFDTHIHNAPSNI